jgi:ABC-type oligopeptide transport system substrate-binding subunit
MREYNYIALIDVETGKIHYQYADDRSDASIRFTLGEYDAMMQQVAPNMRDSAEPGSELGKVSFQTVINELNRQDEYSYVFNTKRRRATFGIKSSPIDTSTHENGYPLFRDRYHGGNETGA